MTTNETVDVTTSPVVTAPAARGTPEWATLLVILAGTFMITLDFFIVNVAIPTMQRDLHATASDIQWTVAGYGLAIAAGVITAGRLGDLYGRRRMYAIGLAVFTLASLACGLAATAPEMVAARVAQGIAAALLTPQVLAIASTAFTGRALTRAFTAYGLSMGIAAVFGQLIGGLLIQADVLGLGWRTCFLINLPIGVVALALIKRTVPTSAGTHSARLDLIGMLTVTLALVAIVLPMIEGQSLGWPTWTYASFAAGAVLATGYAFYQRSLTRRGGVPLIDLSMFRSRGFAVGIGAQLVFWTGQASFFLVFAIYLQEGRGLSALTSGVVFTAIGGGYLVTSMNAGRFAARLGRQSVALGTLLMAVGLIGMIVTVHAIGTTGAVEWLVPSLALDGAGMGIALSPLASIALSYVPARHAGAGAGVLSTAMQVGGALGIAVIGIVFYHGVDGGTGIPSAFAGGLVFLAIVELAVAILIQFLPRPATTNNAAAGTAAG